MCTLAPRMPDNHLPTLWTEMEESGPTLRNQSKKRRHQTILEYVYPYLILNDDICTPNPTVNPPIGLAAVVAELGFAGRAVEKPACEAVNCRVNMGVDRLILIVSTTTKKPLLLRPLYPANTSIFLFHYNHLMRRRFISQGSQQLRVVQIQL